MARTAGKPAGTEFIALPAGSIEDGELLGDELTDEENAFNEFRTGFGAEKMGELRVGKLKLGKDGAPIANSKSAHCFSCPIDRYNFSELLEYIREHYGSGVFRVVGIESGKRGVVFNKLVEIAEDRGPRPAADSALQNPNNMFESVGKIMAESQARTEALIARLTERQPVALPLDPMESMTKMAALFGSLMQSMAAAIPKPATTGGTGDILDQAEKLLKLKELLSGSGGNDSGTESNFYDVVKAGLQSFGPALATLAVRGAQQTQPPALAAPESPQVISTQTAAPSYAKPGPVPKQGDPAMASFKRQVDTLVQNAKLGVDPATLAGTILDLTPDEKLDDLEAMLQAPDMIEKMAALNPEVQTYRTFFDSLRAALLGLLAETVEDTLAPVQGSTAEPAGSSGAPTS
jgi:hypothetical protein